MYPLMATELTPLESSSGVKSIPMAFTTKEFINVVKSGRTLKEVKDSTQKKEEKSEEDFRKATIRINQMISTTPEELADILKEHVSPEKAAGRLLLKMRNKRFPTGDEPGMDYMVYMAKKNTGNGVKRWKILKVEKGKRYIP